MGSSGVSLAGSSSLPVDGGTAAAGTGVNASRYDHVHPRYLYDPTDLGYLAWSLDPRLASSNSNLTGGTLQLTRLHLPIAATITNIVVVLVSAGTSLTSGQSFAVLYSSSGTKLRVTADQSTAWSTGGTPTLLSMALTSSYSAAAGDYYVGMWTVGSSMPAFLRMGNHTGVNGAKTAPNLLFATADTGLTTTAPDPFGSQTASQLAFFVALS